MKKTGRVSRAALMAAVVAAAVLTVSEASAAPRKMLDNYDWGLARGRCMQARLDGKAGWAQATRQRMAGSSGVIRFAWKISDDGDLGSWLRLPVVPALYD